MREILFKAKRIDDGRWESGCYVKETKWCHIADNYVKVEKHYICVNMASSESSYIAKAEVVPETICQYTGLTDKNGCRIWENDVVRCQDVIGKIGWNETHLAYTILAEVEESMRYYYIDESLSSDIEVIGNAFDNPELMNTTETIGYADNGGLMSAT